MEDFYYAGGLRHSWPRIGDLLHLERMTVNGRTHGREHRRGGRVRRPGDPDEGQPGGRGRRPRDTPRQSRPDGAVIKHLAASPHLLRHTGPAVVFEDYRDMQRRVNDPDLEVTRRLGARAPPRRAPGGPGHARVRHAPDTGQAAPRRRARHGPRLGRTHERDELRHLCPARGAGVLRGRPAGTRARGRPHHPRRRRPAPSARSRRGGARPAQARAWTPPPKLFERGYGSLYIEHVGQADQGCDFDFLARSGAVVEPDAG